MTKTTNPIALAIAVLLGVACTEDTPASDAGLPGVPPPAASTGGQADGATPALDGTTTGPTSGAAGPTTGMATGPMTGADFDSGLPPEAGQAPVQGMDAGDQAAPVADAGASEDAMVAAGPILPAAGIDGDGPFETTEDLSTGPDGESGLFRPTELGREGLAHPIFLWGCGGSSQPSDYADHMNRIASHGFVALAVVSRIGDDGDVLTANLDWLLAENERADSPLYGQLDASRIAAGGHSIGSVNTFLMADDPRLLTTVHVAGGSLDDVNNPFAPTTGMGGEALVHPAALLSGETDTFGNVEKLEKDYAATSAPVFFTIMNGADHISVAREALPAIVAWLRWHVGGETALSELFLEPDGTFQTGRYNSKTKNW